MYTKIPEGLNVGRTHFGEVLVSSQPGRKINHNPFISTDILCLPAHGFFICINLELGSFTNNTPSQPS